jgi:hypothetical protein
MAAGDFRFNFSTVRKAPGWTSTSIADQAASASPKFSWGEAQTGVGYSRGIATPVQGTVNPSKGKGWITAFKNDDEVYIRMANGGTAMGVPGPLLKAYLKANPNATLENIPQAILQGTTLRRATEMEDPNSRINQINREIAAMHKNHPDEVLSPMERAILVRKYGQDALGDYDKVYPASATLADTAGSDPAAVGHPKSYAGSITGNSGVISAPVSTALTDLNKVASDLNASNQALVTDWQSRLLQPAGGVSFTYNPADMIRAGTERMKADVAAAEQRRQTSLGYEQSTAQRNLADLEGSANRFGFGSYPQLAIQAARNKLASFPSAVPPASAPSAASGWSTPWGSSANSWKPMGF